MSKIPIRPIRIQGNIAIVSLTQGYEAIIDADDAHLVESYNWCAQVQRNKIYAVRTSRLKSKQHQVRMHRVLMGNPSGFEVDHVDGNGLNNRKINLRKATQSQNQQNSTISKNNTSGFKGVTWSKRSKKWQAQITIDRKYKQIGKFDTPEDAHAAYTKASAELHGEFGRAQ